MVEDGAVERAGTRRQLPERLGPPAAAEQTAAFPNLVQEGDFPLDFHLALE